MPTTLNKIICLANGQKARTKEDVTALYKQVQKPVLFDGLVRTYHPTREDEHGLPPEQKNIQAHWDKLLKEAMAHWTKLLNVVATQDTANCKAIGTVMVDGQAILTDVPVTHLLFLEKHLHDVRTFVSKMPYLDPAETWMQDSNRDCFVTAAQRKVRTRKVPQVLVKYEATDKHAAQTERFDEDIVVGEWQTVLLSGRIPKADQVDMLERIDKILVGVKLAREEANRVPAEAVEIARPLFEFIVAGSFPQTKIE